VFGTGEAGLSDHLSQDLKQAASSFPSISFPNIPIGRTLGAGEARNDPTLAAKGERQWQARILK
jgi:hypothetical protein